MHVKESTSLGSTEDVDIKEEAVDEPPNSTSTSSSTASLTATTAITDASSPSSATTTDSFSPSRDSAVASSEAPLSVSGLIVSPNGTNTSDSVNSLQVPLCSTNTSDTSITNDQSVKSFKVSVDSTSTTNSAVNHLKGSLSGANASDSALETDDSSQDGEMLIAPEDVKLEEVDSDCEDTVDGTVLQHLSRQIYKAEPEDSNSSCSLASFSNGFLNGESDASMRKRLFTSLSQSFPGSALSRILHSCDTMPMDSDDEDLVTQDRLSSSCFGEIRLDKGEIEDDELTSLAWLQDTDLLKNMNAGEDDLTPSEDQKENSEGQKNGDSASGGNFVPQAHPPHVPYNPQKHVNSKPPYSFSCLIFMAVEECPEKKLPVKDIYNWILTHFPYFQNAPTGWKNSVRHNLSLNKCFKKVEKDKGTSIGKGSLWCIDPDYRPNLLQALRKTPYHPYHQLQMMSTMQSQQQIHHVQGVPTSGFRPMPLTQRPVPNTVSPHLFPFLSRRLAQSGIDYFDREMQDVANTLVAMKGSGSKNSSGLSSDGSSDASGPTNAKSSLKRRYSGVFKRQGPFIVTAHPNEDHNYSSVKIREEDAASGTSSIDNEYDFGDEDDDDISEPSDYPSDWDCGSDGDEVDGDLPPAIQRKRLKIDLKRKEDKDKDEEEKQEGAKLLLSLAGFSQYGSNEEEERRSPRKAHSSASNKTASSSKLSKSSSSSSSSTSKGQSLKSSASSVVSKSTSSLSSVSSGSSSRISKSSSRAPSSKLSKTTTPSSKSAASSSSSSSKSSAGSSLSKSTPKSSSVSSSKSSSAASSSKTSVVASLSSKSSVASSSSKASISSSSPSPAKPLNADLLSQDKSSLSVSPSARKSSIIMTRRGKAAAEAAAAAAAPGVCTRGKKLSSS